MQLPSQFDARTVDPSQGASGLPVSDANGHLVVISKSEGQSTKDSTGGFLALTLQIIDQNSPHRGKEGVDRLNLWNSSAQAVDIAYKRFSAYCHATGVYVVQQTEQLHNIPFRVIVGQQKDAPQYTEIKKVLTADGGEPGKPNTGAQQQAAPPPQQQQQWNTGAQPQQGQQPGAWQQPGAGAPPAGSPSPAWGNGQGQPPAPPAGQWNAGQQQPGQGQQPAPGAWNAGGQQPPAPPQPAVPWGQQPGGAPGGASSPAPWGVR